MRGTPQQNGVVERMNRTLLEKVRCLLFTTGLPRSFWGEALTTAAYLVNRTPSSATGYICPEERWSRRKPSINHLRVFGCAAYAHTKDGKLEPRSLRCVFLGYQEGTKGYRLSEREAPGVKLIISRDVVFNECVFLCSVTNINARTSSHQLENPQQTESTQVEVELTNQQEPETNTDEPEYEPEHTTTNTELDGENENEKNIDHVQQDDLAQYQLARDKTRREIRPPARFNYADLFYTALLAGVEIQRTEPDSYEHAINSKDRKN